MKRSKLKHRDRFKAGGIVLAALVVGLGLLVLSRMIAPAGEPTSTAPVGEPTSTVPASAPAPGRGPLPANPPVPGRGAALNMSGLLLMFSLVSFAVAGIGIGWIVFDIRRSRPAWKTQKKYPKKYSVRR